MRVLVAFAILAHLWYPPDCCGGNDDHGDCRPVPCKEISKYSDGLVWHRLYFDEKHRRVSPDTQCHVCARNDAYPFCVFIPEATS
jgi:hypothetical protein